MGNCIPSPSQNVEHLECPRQIQGFKMSESFHWIKVPRRAKIPWRHRKRLSTIPEEISLEISQGNRIWMSGSYVHFPSPQPTSRRSSRDKDQVTLKETSSQRTVLQKSVSEKLKERQDAVDSFAEFFATRSTMKRRQEAIARVCEWHNPNLKWVPDLNARCVYIHC